jgi:hypothetical protein
MTPAVAVSFTRCPTGSMPTLAPADAGGDVTEIGPLNDNEGIVLQIDN